MRFVDLFLQDVRQATRALMRTTGFTAMAVTTLAVGVATVTSMFSVINAALIRPLPLEDPDRLYEVRKTVRSGGVDWLSLPELEDWRSQNRTFSELAGSTAFDFNVRGVPPVGILGIGVTRGYLEMLGARIAVGRGFADDDFEPSSPRVALLTFAFWQERFAANPAIVGTTVDLEGPVHLSESSGPYTIVGVLAPEFWHFFDRSRTHVVLPLRASVEDSSDRNVKLVAQVIGRLGSATGGAAQQDLRGIAARHDREYLPATVGASVNVLPLADAHFGSIRRSLVMLLGATLAVALIASANVALLFLARGFTRARDMAVRTSLGARSIDLARLQFIETGVVSFAGVLLGGALAIWSLQLIRRLIPDEILSRIPGGADAIVLDVTALVAVMLLGAGVAVCSGSAPAWSAFRTRGTQAFGTGRKALQARMSTQRVLVVAEVAVAVMLLAGAGLLLNSTVRLNRVDLGIVPPPGIIVWINLSLSRYPDAEARTRFYDRLIDAAEAHSAIARVSGVDQPFNMNWKTVSYSTTGTPIADANGLPQALDRAVSPEYFAQHGIRLLDGRTFHDRDDASSAAVAIVSDTFAQRVWPGEHPIGTRLTLQERSTDGVAATVVGVVSDVRHQPQSEPMPIVYRPYAQHPPPWMYLTVEGDGGTDALRDAVREAVADVDPFQPLVGPWTHAEWIQSMTGQARLMTTLASVFAGLALLLAALGIYAMLTHMVTRRVHEFGVRIAIGATPFRILREAMSQAMTLAGLGIAIGGVGGVAAARGLEGMLFGVTATDPATLATVGGLFAGVAWVACVIPARRATRVDPTRALRAE